MTRQSRPFVAIIFGLAVLIGILNVISQTIVSGSYAALEEQGVRRDLSRVLNTLASDLDGLNSKAADWATWDAAYEFVQGKNPEFAKTDVTALALQHLDVDLMLFLQPDGKLVLGRAVDLAQSVEIPLPKGVEDFLADRKALNAILQNTNPDSWLTGILLLRENPLMIAARPIVTSEGKGPIRGTLIFGHYLDRSEAREMSAMIQLSLTFQRIDQLPLPDDFQIAASYLSDANPLFVQNVNEKIVNGYASINDISGKPAVILRIDETRDVFQQGQAAIRYFTLVSIGIGILFIGIAHLVLNRLARSQRELSESEERYRAVIEQAAEGIFLYDAATWRVVETNVAFRRLLGSDAPEARALTFYDVFDAERQTLTDIHARIVRERIADMGEQRVRRRDGGTLYVEASASVITYGKREVICAVMRDITERKRAEEALRISEEKFRDLVENIPDVIFTVDSKGTLTYLSPVHEHLSGYKASDLLGSQFADFVHPDDLAHVASNYARVLEGQIAPSEYRVRAKNGDYFWVRSSSKRIVVDDKLTGIQGVMTDIRQRKRAEEEAKRLDFQIQLILEAAGEGIFGLNAEGDHTFVNLMAAKTLGYAVDELMGRHSHTLWHYARPDGTSYTAEECPIYATLRDGSNHHGEEYFWRKDGSGLPVEFTSTPVQEAGQVVGAVVTFRDITERKQTEERIQGQLRRLAALRAIDDAIIGSFDLALVLDVILEQTATQLGIDAVCVLLLNPHSLTLTYAAGRGFRTDTLKSTNLRLGEGYAGQAALKRRVFNIPDMRGKKTDFLRAPHFSAEGFVAYYAVPLVAKGQIEGVLEIFQRSLIRPDPEWLNFLETLAKQAAIAVNNAQLFDSMQRANADLFLAYDNTIEGWSRALDLRDKETEGHTRRVTEMTVRLARAIGMSEAEIVHVRRGALLHDIGKMGVPDAILLKPGKLTDNEWKAMRLHPQLAHDMLAPIAYLRPALDIPYCHHEKWDGTGYPRGLKGEAIPLAARIFAVVDVWDALRFDRPYRAGWPEEKVLQHIRSLAGTHFDPKAVDLFLKMMNEDTKAAG
ncbi:MAG: PAS domain S-box protein [Chloroflexi bacterium]|nr:PAS domain S-box protein [Chloroflexota bacterium]